MGIWKLYPFETVNLEVTFNNLERDLPDISRAPELWKSHTQFSTYMLARWRSRTYGSLCPVTSQFIKPCWLVFLFIDIVVSKNESC